MTAAEASHADLAVLENEVRHLTKAVDANTEEVREWRKELNGRVRDVEKEQARLSAIVKIWGSINTLLTMIVGAAATMWNRQ